MGTAIVYELRTYFRQL